MGGTPQSSILIGFSIINHPFWGTTILGNPQIGTCKLWRKTTATFSLPSPGEHLAFQGKRILDHYRCVPPQRQINPWGDPWNKLSAWSHWNNKVPKIPRCYSLIKPWKIHSWKLDKNRGLEDESSYSKSKSLLIAEVSRRPFADEFHCTLRSCNSPCLIAVFSAAEGHRKKIRSL